jgi:hypothetical protein
MEFKAKVVILYARWDQFGDALLRMPALRAARSAFPDSHIIYGCQDHTAFTTVLRRHVDHLVDEVRPHTPLTTLLKEARSRGDSIVVVDFRAVILTLLAMRLRLLGSGVIYEANMRGYVASSWHGVPFAPRPGTGCMAEPQAGRASGRPAAAVRSLYSGPRHCPGTCARHPQGRCAPADPHVRQWCQRQADVEQPGSGRGRRVDRPGVPAPLPRDARTWTRPRRPSRLWSRGFGS